MNLSPMDGSHSPGADVQLWLDMRSVGDMEDIWADSRNSVQNDMARQQRPWGL